MLEQHAERGSDPARPDDREVERIRQQVQGDRSSPSS
jgi:hypothetical protein